MSMGESGRIAIGWKIFKVYGQLKIVLPNYVLIRFGYKVA